MKEGNEGGERRKNGRESGGGLDSGNYALKGGERRENEKEDVDRTLFFTH